MSFEERAAAMGFRKQVFIINFIVIIIFFHEDDYDD